METKYRIEFSDWDGRWHLEYESRNWWGRKKWYRIPVWQLCIPQFIYDTPYLYELGGVGFGGFVKSDISSKDSSHIIEHRTMFENIDTFQDFITRFPNPSDYYEACEAELEKAIEKRKLKLGDHKAKHKTVYPK